MVQETLTLKGQPYTALYVWFPCSLCVHSHPLLSQLINIHDIRISHIWRSPLHCALRLISMLTLCPLTAYIEPVNQFSW